uniref:Uncharacterized protein n=1 Tax=Anguilla anguilla TaxID=7936 RepID=A0A0E9TZ39_ANGAN
MWSGAANVYQPRYQEVVGFRHIRAVV